MLIQLLPHPKILKITIAIFHNSEYQRVTLLHVPSILLILMNLVIVDKILCFWCSYIDILFVNSNKVTLAGYEYIIEMSLIR